ncbi:hypothetical protein dqs_2019 [Azoarcus olearius]|nr:hypothetical protein dqs_2019 [Azoarcus olearius]
MWSGVAPVVTPGSPPFITTVEFDTAWQLVTRQGVAVVQVQPVPDVSFLACDPASVVRDGMELGGMVGLVWLTVWTFVALRRAAR